MNTTNFYPTSINSSIALPSEGTLLEGSEALVEKYILAKFASKFALDPEHLDLHENLLDLGLDSSTVVKIAEEFEEELEIKLYPTVFFEYKTLQEIIGYFNEEFAENIKDYYRRRDEIVDPPKHDRSFAAVPIPTFFDQDIRGRIANFLTQRIAQILDIRPDHIDMDQNLLDLGLGSSSLVHLAEELEKDVKLTLYPTIFFEYQNLSSIIEYFATDFEQEFKAYFATNEIFAQQVLGSGDPAETISLQQDLLTRKVLEPLFNPSVPPDNLHTYSLQWESAAVTENSHATGKFILLMENEPSEVKKHLLRKAFPGIQVINSKQQLGEIALEENGCIHLIVYVAEGDELLSDPIATFDLASLLFVDFQESAKRVGLLKKKGQSTFTVLIETNNVLASPFFFASRGLLKSVGAEIAYITPQVLAIDTFTNQAVEWIHSQIVSAKERYAAHYKNQSLQLKTVRDEISKESSNQFMDSSTYIISGGSGKLGQLIALYISSQAKCTVVLLGRKPQLDLPLDMPASGQIVYRTCDVTDSPKLSEVVLEVAACYGPIRGVIHAAGIIEDSGFLSKTKSQIKNVIGTKILGLVNLDLATRTQPVDFFVGFSSVSSFMGNRGQTDYAFGNGFMDGYLRRRHENARQRQLPGKSISINWPLWESGGMMPNPMVIQMMEKGFGISTLPNADGLYAFDRILSGSSSQVCVIKGQKEKFEKLFGEIGEVKTTILSQPIESIGVTVFSGKEKLPVSNQILNLEFLTTQWAEIMQHDVTNPKAPLGTGNISTKLTKLLEVLNVQFQKQFPPSVLVDAKTIEDIYKNILGFMQPTDSEIFTTPTEQSVMKRVEETKLESVTSIKKKINHHNKSAIGEIAIIGLDGRFPKSPDASVFWKNLVSEQDMISLTPNDRLNWWKHVSAFLKTESEEDYLLSGGYIEGVDEFDAQFFNISAREAEVMDPQQRLFMESVWKCIQDAGYCQKSLSGSKTGVFAAVSTRDYHELLLLYGVSIEPQHSTGLAHSILPNRVSYWLNLHGPSEAIDTACSSSLVALHRAVQAIQNGDCEQAIVGGVNLILSPLAILAFGKTGILGKDGRCKTFDKDANGYARGEGVGSLFLKPLDKALEDGDVIHGVIKGTSVNHGGRGNSLTAPNPAQQAEVIGNAILKSGCDINTITYIEAHGTGTALGDPVEVEGLKRAFRRVAKEQEVPAQEMDYCGIGSVKSNIGHLESAAGIAGIIKVLMALRHNKLPASLHIKELNPYINLSNSPFYIVNKTQDWKQPLSDLPRRAGVSSFGFGGANAHVILEQFMPRLQASNEVRRQVFPFSAPSSEQLFEYLKKFAAFLEDRTDDSLTMNQIAYTLQTGRSMHEYRYAFTASSFNELKTSILEFLNTNNSDNASQKVIPVVLSKTVQDEASANLLTDLHRKGDLTQLAQLWMQGMLLDWRSFYDTLPVKASIPTFPLKKNRHWLNTETSDHVTRADAKATIAVGIPLLDRDRSQPELKKTDEVTILDVQKFLMEEISVLLKKDINELDITTSLLEYGLDSILGMTLVKKLEQKLGIPVYVNEIIQYDTIEKLSSYLAKESTSKKVAETEEYVNPAVSVIKHNDDLGEKISKPAVFLLSTPRSGSTLLRAMLMGHSKLFAPPELHLLNFNDLNERKQALGQSGFGDGLLETIKVLKSMTIEEAKAWINEKEVDSLSVKDMYQLIQEMAGDQLLVDKSPSYASDINILRRAEKQFANAKYIFLVRHPYAVMESVVRNRFHKFVPGSEVDPNKKAEKIWFDFNKNVVEFINKLTASNALTVHYEDLVADPQAVLSSISDFLGLPFESAMLDPYQKDRLITGLHENSLSIGDPNFLKHNKVEKKFATCWQESYEFLPSLNPETKELASYFGYDVGQELPLNMQQEAFLLRFPEKKRWLLVHDFTFSPNHNENIGLDDLTQATDQLIDLYPLLHRKLKANKKFEWERLKENLRTTCFRDLRGQEENVVLSTITGVTDKIKLKIDIETGPVLGIALFHIREQMYKGVLIYHHLIGDGMTSLKLLRNLGELLNETTATVPAVTESYLRFIDQALKKVGNEQVYDEKNKIKLQLPLDDDQIANHFGQQVEERCSLSLVKMEGSNLNLFFIIGAALAEVLSSWTGEVKISMDIRYHGRNLPGYKDSFVETPGLFAFDLPVTLVLPSESLPSDLQRSYNEARRELARNIRQEYHPVRFNFQPYQKRLSENNAVVLENSSELFDTSMERINELDCIVRKSESDLEFIIRYSGGRFRQVTIEGLLHSWINRVDDRLFENRN